ncbi:MAG: type transport system permease protein, partial [Frankiaceae bacterium]|nr:type transport system permease protein [Frankiaceae bacterium]
MTGLIRAELLKIRTTKLVYWLGLTAAALAGVSVAGTVFSPQQAGMPALATAQGVRTVFAAASSGSALSMVLGIIGMAGEWRHRTATATFLGVPRRGRVVAAKVLAHAVIGFVYAVLVVAVTVLTAVICLRVKHVHYSITGGGIPSVLVGAALVTVIYAVLGVGYGALVRNQIAAIVSAL